MPTVSVVIATYNRGPKIRRTLESVLAQSWPAYEIVVVDDASPDETGVWVQMHFPTVHIIGCAQNGGTSAARNRGGHEAKGDVLVFLDHDDELLPHALAVLLELFEIFPEARAAYADHSYTNLVTGVHYDNHHAAQAAFARLQSIPIDRALPQGRLYSGRSMYRALLRGNLLQQPWAVDRRAFLELGGFAPEIRYCEDWDMYLRIARAMPVALSDRVISKHIIEGDNLHLAEGQDEMQRRVMLRQLKQQGWTEWRDRALVHRRLGMSYKTAGDRAGDLSAAWRWYWRSFRAWPFDHVVAARTLWWPLRLLFAAATNAPSRST